MTLGDLALEKTHFKHHREVELAQVRTGTHELARIRRLHEAHATLQVREVFQELGIQGKTLDKACAHVGASDETLMSFMKVLAISASGRGRVIISRSVPQAFEFGCNDDDLQRSPFRAGLTAGGLFSVGALAPVLTFGFLEGSNALIYGSLASCLVLFLVGAYKTRITRLNPLWGGLENMLCGCIGAACEPRRPGLLSICARRASSFVCSVLCCRAYL